MDRPQRIKMVAVCSIGLLAFVVGIFGSPVVAVMSAPSPSDMEKSMPDFIRHIQLANQVSMICLATSGVCLLYLLITFASWFIGPKEETVQTSE